MGRISRGWGLAKQSWAVLKSDSSLLIFPILSTVFAIVAVVAIWAPTAVLTGVLETESVDSNNPVYYIAAAATAYVSTFIATFFNVALASCAARSLAGEDTSVGDGMAAAGRHIGAILGWTLVAATVGLILRIIENRLPAAGQIAAWIAGAAWAIATFFVIPVIALEGGGPWTSLKRSAAVVKARWGEGATGAVAISAVTGIAVFVLVLFGTAGGIALFSIDLAPVGIAVVAVAVVGIIVVSLISSALSGIFRVAVYRYAVTGEAPGAFDRTLMEAAFKEPTRRGVIR